MASPTWSPTPESPERRSATSWLPAVDGLWPAVEAKVNKAIAEKKPGASAEEIRSATVDSIRAIMMIRAYRIRGHLAAHLDPLNLVKVEDQPELDPKTYGFGPKDMDRRIYIDNVLGLEYATPRQMVDILKRTYCGTFAVEFMHISDPEEKSWLQQRIEGKDKEISFTPQGKRAILKKLVEAEAFERFLHKRYPGTKRFGLDGGEAAVPALEQIIKRGGALGVDEIIVGMPHRGRLNVLAAVMGKPYHKIFFEFQGGNTQGGDDYGSGDVKYHLGASSDREFDGHNVHLSLTANPSHLEIVNPVVLGKARAKQFFDEVEAGEADAARRRGGDRTRARPAAPRRGKAPQLAGSRAACRQGFAWRAGAGARALLRRARRRAPVQRARWRRGRRGSAPALRRSRVERLRRWTVACRPPQRPGLRFGRRAVPPPLRSCSTTRGRCWPIRSGRSKPHSTAGPSPRSTR